MSRNGGTRGPSGDWRGEVSGGVTGGGRRETCDKRVVPASKKTGESPLLLRN